MESNDDDLGNRLPSKTKYCFLDGPLPTTCRKCPNKVAFKNQKGILWTLILQAIVFVNLLLMSDVGFVPQVHGPELSVSMVNEFD